MLGRTSRFLLVVIGLSLVAIGCGEEKKRTNTAGVPNGPKLVLSYGTNSRPYMPSPERLATQVAADLREVGFDIELRPVPWNQYIDFVSNHGHELALLGWSADFPDADNFLRALLHGDSAKPGGNNISYFKNEQFDAAVNEARDLPNGPERLALLARAQQIVFDEMPMVPIVYTDRVIAYRNSHGPFQVEPVTHPVLRLAEKPVDGTLVWLRGKDSNGLDPGDITDGESSKVIERIFDTLVRYTPGTADVEPSLATSWENSEDRRTWTFQIREGVKFHDGTDLDGAAVVNTFERMRDPAHPHHFEGGEWANWRSFFTFVEKVEVGSHPMEVVFRCNEAAPPFFLHQLAMFGCSILSPASLDKHGKAVERNPVGTGPFRMVSWASDSEMVLERNEDYWGERPALARVIFRVSQNETIRSEQLLTGSVHLIDNVAPSTLPRLEESSDVTVNRMPGSSMGYLSMNLKSGRFNDLRIREAIALALNKEQIIRLAYQGSAYPAGPAVPPAIYGHADGIKSRPHDPERARQLLREAGYE